MEDIAKENAFDDCLKKFGEGLEAVLHTASPVCLCFRFLGMGMRVYGGEMIQCECDIIEEKDTLT